MRKEELHFHQRHFNWKTLECSSMSRLVCAEAEARAFYYGIISRSSVVFVDWINGCLLLLCAQKQKESDRYLCSIRNVRAMRNFHFMYQLFSFIYSFISNFGFSLCTEWAATARVCLSVRTGSRCAWTFVGTKRGSDVYRIRLRHPVCARNSRFNHSKIAIQHRRLIAVFSIDKFTNSL